MDSLPPGHHPDWRTSVLLLIWGTASPEGFLGAGGSCLPRYAGAPREHGLAMLGAPGGLCWTGSPSTHQWAYPAHTRGSFRFTTKGTKGVPGALPLDPVGGLLSSPQRRQAPLPPERGASSDGTQAINRLPRHGLTAGSVPLIEPKEKIRPICPPTQSGKSVFFCGTNPIEGVAGTAGGAGAKSVSLFARSPLGEYPEGVSPSGRFFGDFLIGEKVTRGGGAERPPLGGCGGKRPPLGECRGAKPRVRRECRGGPAPSQKSPRSPGSYKFPEDSVSIKENKSSTSSRFKSRRWCLCLPSE